ncbi:GntR family transcriptional regulator [Cellulomonas edaphi]|uniref:GntR family transcriptional regulator n=1 Tax=Cellulomonas edaphi TaxID=3053468 RepID=A0ABT7S3T1_9CELL|nr:GntR family transcriptional regulator [Cellulomons edaphi]MDM7830281.1 GntR family transcriptional regulator [Cellulomons edaphi]
MPIPTERVDLVGAPARDAVFELLLRRIVTGELAPGSRLRDGELLATTDASRVPLREALNRLETLGLVRVVPRQLTEVTPIDPRRTAECLELLGAVVGQALVETAGRLTADDASNLLDLRDIGLRDDATAFATLTDATYWVQFPSVIVGRTGNDEYRSLCQQTWPYVERSLAHNEHALDVTGWRRALVATIDGALEGDAAAALTAWHAAVEHTAAPFVHAPADVAPPARPVVLRERAATVIQRAILDGTLEPGEQLRESALMAWLGISRTPVRDALALLASRRLVTLETHRPARVATLDHEEFVHVLRALGVLRRVSLGDALSGKVDVPTAWGTTLDRIRGAASLHERIAAVDELSAAITAAGDNLVATQAMDLLEARARWYLVRDPQALEAYDGEELVRFAEAVRSGDVEAAVRAHARVYDTVTARR